VDGEGAARVAMVIGGKNLRVRRASLEDCALLWQWANDPEVRESSFSTNFISWDGHVTWFSKKILDPNCFQYIALDEHDNPVGQVRFEVKRDGEADIGLSIDRNIRGSGLGSIILNSAIEAFYNNVSIKKINAFIKKNNVKSIITFERARFKIIGPTIINGNESLHYVWRKDI
jgi:UDP-2,4-diacetamido-2,4,6-trideoxy-beta-L-altropyranose hydrolase